MTPVEVRTIGFTQSSAERFFGRLHAAGVTKVVDVRLHNTSQLAGFAKADDLAYFLGRLGGIAYEHRPVLAPTAELLAAYKKRSGSWAEYEAGFMALMAERQVETSLDPGALEGACLLCSEPTAHRCHRRLVVEYLNARWGGRLAARHL